MKTLDQPGSAHRTAGRPRGDGRPHLTRPQVFLAAARLIAEHGYTGTSVRMIANAVDASPASLFNLFATKDDLLNALVVYLAQPSLAFYRQIEALAPGKAVAAAALYRMVYEETLLVASVDRAFAAVFLLPELRLPQFQLARSARGDLVSCYERRIRLGVESKTLVCDHPRHAAEQLFQLTETSLIVSAPSENLTPETQARATARFCLRGLLASPETLEAVENAALDFPASLQIHAL